MVGVSADAVRDELVERPCRKFAVARRRAVQATGRSRSQVAHRRTAGNSEGVNDLEWLRVQVGRQGEDGEQQGTGKGGPATHCRPPVLSKSYTGADHRRGNPAAPCGAAGGQAYCRLKLLTRNTAIC